MVEQKFVEFVRSNVSSCINDIVKLVSIPSVSARKQGLEECSEQVEKMLIGIGASTRILKVEGAAPLVYGEIRSTKSSRTIMFYNHYDVQPEDPVELWKSHPFMPEIREGRIYGRGVADDKGELVSRVKLIEAYNKVYGEPPCNIKFCFEGEEETGSVHLNEYVERNKELFKADALFWEFGTIDSSGRPSISLGMKGMLYVELVLRELERDVHSSLAAVLPSAAWRMVRLLNILKDENERIRVPGWYDHVENITEEEERILKEEEFDSRQFLAANGAKSFLPGMTEEQVKKALSLRPTANISGIWSGYTGPGSKTVLPMEARCKIDFRLVPDQDPEDLVKKLRKFLEDNGYGDVEVIVDSMEKAARTSPNNAFVKSTYRAGEKVFGKKPVINLSSPGTGPLYVFTERYKIPAVSIGISSEDSMLHAPNENLRVENIEKGILWFAETIEDYLRTTTL